MLWHSVRIVAAGFVFVALAACGSPTAGGSSAASLAGSVSPGITGSSAAGQTAGSGVPDCAKAGSPIALPAEFPATFPLPPGTIITSQEKRSGDRIIISGFAPSDAKGVATFWEDALPKAGFKRTGGESEPGEAEANFEGNGVRGRWTVNDVANCPNAVRLTVLAGR